MKHPILQMIETRKNGHPVGIYSACTASEQVLAAVMAASKNYGIPALVEATANQCNQFGGYTGMTPADYVRFIHGISEKAGCDPSLLILGGDHLGPLTWTGDAEGVAMDKACELVRQYVAAGFTKIHLDTSMRLADDDKTKRLPDKVIAARAAKLALVCEREAEKNHNYPVYVIGSEVPIPGGAQEEEDGVAVTTPADFEATFDAFRAAFHTAGLDDAFSRVTGVVVQPGVEFGDDVVLEYDRPAAKALTGTLSKPRYSGIVFEGHSTDYQPPQKLREMVEDGIAILKVGPALTFYFREAVFALADIEQELNLPDSSNFKSVLENLMLAEPKDWAKYYRGKEAELKFKRQYSLSDRSRYYFPHPDIKAALAKLYRNIDSARVPVSLLSQYLPSAYARLRNNGLKAPYSASDLACARITDCIDDYLYATGYKAHAEYTL